jgi:Holliday junction resolvase
MTINSRAKGKRGELEIAHLLREYGYDDARRTAQYCGNTGDASDVVGLPHIHIEVKRVERLNIEKAMEQSSRDARDGEVPVVMHRKDRHPWLVTMSMGDFMEMYSKVNGND